MRILIKATLVATALFAATPVLAWTVQAVPSVGSAGSRFSDPDEALESEGSSLRDSVVSNSLSVQGGAAFNGGAQQYRGDAQSYGFGSVTSTSQTYGGQPADGFGNSPYGDGVSAAQFPFARHR